VKRAVVDASVAANWVVEEADSDLAASLRQCEALFAPSHWRAEAANAVWSKFYKGELSGEQARSRIMLLGSAPLHETAIADLMQPAADIALECRVTIYDALYVALAVARQVPLATADRRLCATLRGSARYRDVAILLGSLAGA
jgi:predicted nucleic acid-binding protein